MDVYFLLIKKFIIILFSKKLKRLSSVCIIYNYLVNSKYSIQIKEQINLNVN